MARTPDIYHGLNSWIDYDRKQIWQRVWTVSEGRAGILASTVAVALTLASPGVFVITWRIIEKTWMGFSSAPPGTLRQSSIFSRLRESRTPENGAIEMGLLCGQTLAPRNHMPSMTSGRFYRVLWSNFKENWGSITTMVLLSLLFTLLFLGVTIGSITSARVATDSIAISDSPLCGLWMSDTSSQLTLNNRSSFDYRQEMEAASYAKRCDGALTGADGCNFFLHQDIHYEERHNASCPFAEGFCLEGPNSAYSLSTGLVDSRTLGINVPVGYTFNRTTICAPVLREGYVGLDKSETFIEYYYGSYFGQSNYTWSSPLEKPLTIPGYDVATFCSLDSGTGWKPIPELSTADNSSITLLLVSSQKNFHPRPRSDPIFPAEEEVILGDTPFYVNLDPVSTVLACADKTSVCDASGRTCWENTNLPRKELQSHVEKIGYYMLDFALLRSRSCQSILRRGGNALDAQAKLDIYFSLALPEEQWKVEARNLFATSLARIQIDLRDYIRGSAAHEPGFVDRMDSAYKDMCTMYKFKSVGWRNVSVWGFWLLISVAIAISISSIGIPIRRPPLVTAESEESSSVLPDVSTTAEGGPSHTPGAGASGSEDLNGAPGSSGTRQQFLQDDQSAETSSKDKGKGKQVDTNKSQDTEAVDTSEQQRSSSDEDPPTSRQPLLDTHSAQETGEKEEKALLGEIILVFIYQFLKTVASLILDLILKVWRGLRHFPS